MVPIEPLNGFGVPMALGGPRGPYDWEGLVVPMGSSHGRWVPMALRGLYDLGTPHSFVVPIALWGSSGSV